MGVLERHYLDIGLILTAFQHGFEFGSLAHLVYLCNLFHNGPTTTHNGSEYTVGQYGLFAVLSYLQYNQDQRSASAALLLSILGNGTFLFWHDICSI
jgi:hypothetical protein